MHEAHARRRGFTLIELLIVIAIIGFLAAAILVAVDPVKRIQDARDSRRFAEANAILNAILTKQIDDRSLYSGESAAPIITHATNSQVIVRDSTGIVCNAIATRPGCEQTLDTTGANKNCVADLTGIVPSYISELPIDPRGAGTTFCGTGSGCTTVGDLALGATNTGYYIHRTSGNRLEVGSCRGEQTSVINVKR